MAVPALRVVALPGALGSGTVWRMSRRSLILLAVGALVARLLYALVALRGYVPLTDADHYHEIATAVAEGRGLVHPFPTGVEHPTAFRPPLWPLLLGGVYAVTGPSLGVAQVVTAVLGSLAAVGVALLGARLAGPVAGLAAGTVVAVHPVLVSGDAPPLSEPLGAVLLVGLLLAAAERRVVATGLLGGALLLTRPSAQAAVLALLVALVVVWGVRRAVAVALVAALVTAPWLIRNVVQLGSPVLTTSTGFNLGATYSPTALEAGGFVDPVFDERFESVRAAVQPGADSPPGAVEAGFDDAFAAVGLAGLRDDPLAPLGVVLRNVPRLLAVPGEPAARAADLRDGRSDLVQDVVHVPGLLLLAAGLAGLWLLVRREWRPVLPLLAVALAAPAASLITVAAPRLRQPLDLLACVGVGVVVALVLERRRRGAETDAARHPSLR